MGLFQVFGNQLTYIFMQQLLFSKCHFFDGYTLTRNYLSNALETVSLNVGWKHNNGLQIFLVIDFNIKPKCFSMYS